jgi:hypothetical protein
MALSRLHPSPVWGRCLAVPLLLSVVLACNQKTQEGHGLLPPKSLFHSFTSKTSNWDWIRNSAV